MARPTLDQLINRDDPGWRIVEEWIAAAVVRVEVLPSNEPARSNALLALRVTTRSPMGAIAYECGGLVVDDGWLTILGCGHERAPWSVASLTRDLEWWPDAESQPALLAIAYDAVGGVFVLDGGALQAPGKVHYFAPDSLRWENLEIGYGQFVATMLSERLAKFYESLRWEGWQVEVARCPPGKSIHIAPPLFTRESRPIEKASRRPVPVLENIRVNLDFARQLSQ